MAQDRLISANSPVLAAQAAPRHILVRTSCRHKDEACQPGLSQDFKLSGTACMAGGDHPRAGASRVTGKATWRFGDILPYEDFEALQ